VLAAEQVLVCQLMTTAVLVAAADPGLGIVDLEIAVGPGIVVVVLGTAGADLGTAAVVLGTAVVVRQILLVAAGLHHSAYQSQLGGKWQGHQYPVEGTGSMQIFVPLVAVTGTGCKHKLVDPL